MAVSAGTRLGPYEILGPLGAGGMGEVYRARDTRLGREVAIKVLPAELAADSGRLKRFEKEARSASALNHPNIVTIHDIGSADSVSYIAMERIDGKTLRELLVAGPLPLKKLLPIAAQIAEGLSRAHEIGVLHRDLKPENVMVTRGGLVKILDFGLAKLTHLEVDSGATGFPTETATTPGVILGTVAYMSPEQASGYPVDFRSDQFSFGSILYEMTSGKHPFKRSTPPQTLAAIIQDEPEPIASLAPQTPAPLRWIVERCLAKEPVERYASTEDLARDVRSVSERASEIGSSGEAASSAPRHRGVRHAPVVLFAALAAALIVGLIVGTWALRPPISNPSFQRLTFRRGSIGGARFGPDGQTIIYSAAWDGSRPRVFTTRLGATESRDLGFERADLLAVSSLGELALSFDPKSVGGPIRTGTLAQAPLAGGSPRALIDNVQDADWSTDGKQLAIVRDVGARNRLELPPGKVVAEIPLPGAYWGPRLSPTSNWIAVGEFTDRVGPGALVALDRSGNKTTLEPQGSFGFAWSPKGDEIWFSTGRSGQIGSSLAAVRLSGKKRALYSAPIRVRLQDVSRDGRVLVAGTQGRAGIMALAPGDVAERDLSWLDRSGVADLSDDGKTLLFNEIGEGGGPNESVYVRKTDGSAAIRLGEGWTSALTADGRWALTVPPGGSRLLLLPIGAGETRALTYSGIESILAAWPFPDGNRVLLQAREKGQGARLYVGTLTGGKLTRITPEGIGFYGVSISPDGTLVTAIAADRVPMFYPAEGSASARPVPGLSAGDVPIRFTAHGRELFVSRLDELPARVFRVDLDTGRKELWKELAPADRAGVESVRPIRMTPDGASYAYSYQRVLGDLILVDGLK